MTKAESDKISYKTMSGAIWYIWFLILGQPDVDGFSVGKQSMEVPLIIVFCIAAFIMLIHLLNMLIAIMGNTFAERSAISAEIRIRDHLTFVINNWYLSDLAFGSKSDKEKLKYVITAFSINEDYYKHDITIADLDRKMEILMEQKSKLIINELRNDLKKFIK